jgi:hypothetical protein
MTTDLITLFDRSPTRTPADLHRCLAAGLPEVNAVVERFRHRWIPQEWDIRTNQRSGHAELLGPGGFCFAFHDGLLHVYHLVPFAMFAGNDQVRTELRRVWRIVAAEVESSRAIYTHELMPYRGTSLDAIDSELRVLIGPPAVTFAELAEAEQYSAHAWYSDRFADL